MKWMGPITVILGMSVLVQAAQADWTTAQRLTWTPGDSYNPVIAVGLSGNLHVIWFDNTPGSAEIYYKKSTDTGATWLTSQRLTWTSGWSGHPDLAVDSSGNPHAVWKDVTPGNEEIYYKESPNGGTTWGTSQRLTWNSGSSAYPALTIDSTGTRYLVWADNTPGNYEVYYKKSADAGATWTTSQRLTWTSAVSEYPAIAVDPTGDLHVVWADNTPGNKEIYYKKSPDGGSTWTASRRLTWSDGSSEDPAIAVDSTGDLYLVWDEGTPGNEEIHHKKSTDGGVSWTASQRLTWMSGGSHRPAVGADSADNVHVVWEDYTHGIRELYGKTTTDGGATWATSQRLTWTSGDSYWADLAVDTSNNVHVTWNVYTGGNFEIYFKKNTVIAPASGREPR